MINRRKTLFITLLLLLSLLSMVLALPNTVFMAQVDKKVKKSKSSKKKKKEATFRVDIRDQDIQNFLKVMSAIIGKNIVTDDKVKGKITVISPNKMKQSEAFNYMTSVLAVQGYGVVEEGELIKIFPMKEAIAKGQIIYYHKGVLPADQLEVDRIITHIVPLNSESDNKPSRIAAVLKRVTNASTSIVDMDELNVVIITGGSYEVNRLVKIIENIDNPVVCEESPDSPQCLEDPKEKSANIHIYYLENLDAEKMEATLRRLPVPKVAKNSANSASSGKSKKKKPPINRNPNPNAAKINVFAHKESNSLIYIGSNAEYREIKSLIKKIDIARQQVLLEVLIVEVASSDTNDFGIDWKAGPNAQFNSGLAASAGAIDPKTGKFSGSNTLDGFSLGFINGDQTAGAILNYNISNSNFNVISAPQVLTLDNQEAEINVGQDVPVSTGQRFSGAGSQQVTINQYEYRPTGVKLKFTPQVNKNSMVTLQLFQEIKDIASAGSGSINPTFTKRDVKTTVRVADNQTIVIGGLVSKTKSKAIRKVPLLGDIPLLGYLFKRTSSSVRKTNLLVFITPHILTSRKRADKVTNELLNKQANEIKKREESLK